MAAAKQKKNPQLLKKQNEVENLSHWANKLNKLSIENTEMEQIANVNTDKQVLNETPNLRALSIHVTVKAQQ